MNLNELIEFAKENNINFNQDITLVNYDPRYALSWTVNTEYLSQASVESGRLFLFASCFKGESVAKNPNNHIPGIKFIEQDCNGLGKIYHWKKEPEPKERVIIDVDKEKFGVQMELGKLGRDYDCCWGGKLVIGTGIKDALYEKMPDFFQEENVMILDPNVSFIGSYKYRYKYKDNVKEGLTANIYVDSTLPPYRVDASFYDDDTMKSKFESILGEHAEELEYSREVCR